MTLELGVQSEQTSTIIRQWMAKDGKCYWFEFETSRLQKNGLRIRINKEGKPVLARKKAHFRFVPGIRHVEVRFIHPIKGA